MKKGMLAALLAALVIVSTSSISVASALPNEKAKEATSKAQGVLAEIPVDLPDIDAITFIFYAKPPGTPGKGPGGGGGETGGYKLLRGGVKWADGDLPVSYSVNTAGYDGVGDAFNAITAAFETWDAAVAKDLFNDVVGTTTLTGTLFDGNNTVSWAYIDGNNIIAQCTIWFYVNTKEIIEFDIEFNTQQTWGIDSDGEGGITIDAFDIQNIATHESGHTLHLGDLYDSGYSEMTMYGYAGIGEVNKRSLEWGDINGVHTLYGA